jgi:hypothetical protein
MSIERVYYCDWRECERNAQTTRPQPRGFLTVAEDDAPPLHFCSWDCVLKHAAEKPPLEIIAPASD